ncbi:hypothetical protein E4U36_005946 [Claviceps purpurea]|nr:hypothetical protein E4U51_001495 [Claviceps purpurea]KAG6179101.1 hypothetical protein E4U36_005946 [Claviceps purpurea]
MIGLDFLVLQHGVPTRRDFVPPLNVQQRVEPQLPHMHIARTTSSPRRPIDIDINRESVIITSLIPTTTV